jgi:protein phosphatase
MLDKSARTAELSPTGQLPHIDSEAISSRTVVDVAALSHAGKVRPNNEDSFLVTRFGRSMRTLLTNLPSHEAPNDHAEIGYAMMVADGMGGAVGGEIASRTAISTLAELAIETPDWILRLNEARGKRVLGRMEDRFNRLKDVLEKRIEKDPDLSGMGTTLTLAVSLGSDLIVSHVGDSRAYLFTCGQLVRLTKDQTMAQLLAEVGVIRQEDIDKHHARHVLTSAIGTSGNEMEVELHHLRIADEDQLLICSDGLTEMVSDEDIATVLRKGQRAADTCQELLTMALDTGGRDNVTVIVAHYKIPSAAPGTSSLP